MQVVRFALAKGVVPLAAKQLEVLIPVGHPGVMPPERHVELVVVVGRDGGLLLVALLEQHELLVE